MSDSVSSNSIPFGIATRKAFFDTLDPHVHFLNHGSFGLTPKRVFNARIGALESIERNVDLFCRHKIQRDFHSIVALLAPVVHLSASDSLVFVDNATTGVHVAIAAAIRSLRRRFPADEIVLVDFSNTYNACQIIVSELAAASGLRRVRVQLGASGCALELSESQIVDVTRLALEEIARGRDSVRIVLLVDHITSMTGATMPLADIAAMARLFGATVVADGAHAIGQIDIDLSRLQCDFYVTNLHKWCFVPRGCALLHTAEPFQADTYPLLISHHHLQTYQKRFLMQATRDESRWLSVPAALAFVNEQLGGFDRVWSHQHSFLERSCARLAQEWGTRVMFSTERFRAMALVELPPIAVLGEPVTDARAFAFCSLLFRRWHVVVPVPLIGGKLYVRISAQVYTDDDDIDALSRAIAEARAAKTLDDIAFDAQRDWLTYNW